MKYKKKLSPEFKTQVALDAIREEGQDRVERGSFTLTLSQNRA